MSNHEEDKLFKYATKEDGFSFINLIEEINWDIRRYDNGTGQYNSNN